MTYARNFSEQFEVEAKRSQRTLRWAVIPAYHLSYTRASTFFTGVVPVSLLFQPSEFWRKQTAKLPSGHKLFLSPAYMYQTTEISTFQEWSFNGSASSDMQIDCDDSSSKSSSRVRFSEEHEVAPIPSRCDLSFEELNAMWFNNEDYAELHVENEITEAVMVCEKNKHLVDDEVLCSRGLTDVDSLEARAESSGFVQKLVLNQIAFQVNQGNVDLGLVAKLYHDCAVPAVQKAQDAAQKDAEDAKRYCDVQEAVHF
jgi:hypothetical protein